MPGDGALDAPIAFVGEAPGQVEDQNGLPFVGPAGELLRTMVDAMPGLPHNMQCFWSNVYHCRPPRNDVEYANKHAAICPSIWLNAELQRLAARQCKVVVAVGQTACHYFRPGDTDMPMRWHAAKDNYDEKRKMWIIGARHPAAVLHAQSDPDPQASNRILASIVWSLQRAAYYLRATGSYIEPEDVPTLDPPETPDESVV